MFHAQQFFAEFTLEMLRSVLLEFTADHLMNHTVGICGRDRLGGDMLAVAQNGYGVAKTKNFFEPMRNVNDRDAALLELAKQFEKMLAFANRQRTGRLIHDDD